MSTALEAEGLHTFYGKSHILHGVSLQAAEGKITTLLGRNGAGKNDGRARRCQADPRREGLGDLFGYEPIRDTDRIRASDCGVMARASRRPAAVTRVGGRVIGMSSRIALAL
jgi:branched-chain amino acid transport system ATP-binding protein